MKTIILILVLALPTFAEESVEVKPPETEAPKVETTAPFAVDVGTVTVKTDEAEVPAKPQRPEPKTYEELLLRQKKDLKELRQRQRDEEKALKEVFFNEEEALAVELKAFPYQERVEKRKAFRASREFRRKELRASQKPEVDHLKKEQYSERRRYKRTH